MFRLLWFLSVANVCCFCSASLRCGAAFHHSRRFLVCRFAYGSSARIESRTRPRAQHQRCPGDTIVHQLSDSHAHHNEPTEHRNSSSVDGFQYWDSHLHHRRLASHATTHQKGSTERGLDGRAAGSFNEPTALCCLEWRRLSGEARVGGEVGRSYR